MSYNECDGCNRRDSQIEDLQYALRNARDKIRDLEAQECKTRSELYSAEFRIRQELEPMIKEKEMAYDRWVTDPRRGYEEE